MKSTWVLVCDASRARLLTPGKRGERWVVIETFDHPESRMHAQELVSDQQGHVQQSGNPSSRPGMEPRTDPHDVEAQHFARMLVQRLQQGLDRRSYEQSVVVAPPRFLGVLRGLVSTPVNRAVAASVAKDYTHADEAELEKRLRPILDKTHHVE